MHSLFRVIMLLVIISLPVLVANAQTPTIIIVENGSIDTGSPCPAERDSVSYATITGAVGCALPGDTILISAGTYVENIILDKDLTLTGAGTAVTIVDGGMSGRVFTIESSISALLTDLTITGGEAESGGGVYTESGNLELHRVIIAGNQATSAGGGVYSGIGNASIADSTIANNVLIGDTQGGGGIYIASGMLTISNSVLTGNLVPCGANAHGSAVYVHTGSASILDSAISGNGDADCSDSLYTFAGMISIERGSVTDTASTGENGQIAGIMVPTQPPVLGEDGRIARRWMEIIQQAVQHERLSPPAAARVYAYAGVTLYEAVVPGIPGYRSLVGQLNGLEALPQPDATLSYDWPLVAISALAPVAAGLFEGASDETLNSFTSLRDELAFERGETVPVNTFNRSREYGEAIGQALLKWASADNYIATRSMNYILPTGSPSFWAPLDGQQPLEPYWGMLRPFALPLAGFCDVRLNVPFSAEAGSEFYTQAEEIYRTTTELTPDEKAIASFWADTPGDTATPPGHWISIENQMVELLKLDLGRAAEMYALTGIAMGDAFISAWETKYRVQLLRPVTYIRTYIDPDWSPFIGTPPFPEYPSGHSVASGAAAVVLEQLLGDVPFDDLTHLSRTLPPRSFTSFPQAADEAAMSRMYGGIHFRFSIENGLEQGRCVGQQLLSRVQLRE